MKTARDNCLLSGGKLLLELNRLLRPGGYFVWSATPVYQKLPEDVEIWDGTVQNTSFKHTHCNTERFCNINDHVPKQKYFIFISFEHFKSVSRVFTWFGHSEQSILLPLLSCYAGFSFQYCSTIYILD